MEDDELVSALEQDENELDRLDPVPEIVTLKSGIEVRVLDLRTRQLFKLLRIITHGAGQALMQSGLDFGDDAGVFMQKLVTLVVFSIPDAEQEAIEFLQSMLEPVGLCDKPPRDLTDKERQHNLDLWTELNQETWNPDPEDTLDLIENFVRREAKDIQALGKRVRRFLDLASKTGQLKDRSGRPSQDVKLPESSPASSTSSRTSTAGRTRKSSTSPSGGSARSSRPSRAGTGKKNAAAVP